MFYLQDVEIYTVLVKIGFVFSSFFVVYLTVFILGIFEALVMDVFQRGLLVQEISM